MSVVERDVSAHLSTSRIRLLLVQLNSPFGPEKELQFFRAFGQYQWIDRAQSIDLRVRKVSSILDFLRSHREFSPNIMVFPEYAIPRECHAALGTFAIEQRCIVVSGSYYETERGEEFYRSNVCKTFLPDGQVLMIAKRHCYQPECEALTVLPDHPNVLRLTWSFDRGKTASASVFICRDYLMTYEVDSEGHPRSLLDLQRSGLNVVVMCSGETRPFHASATLDVRRFRGGGKFVALCNCSGEGVEGTGGGSAFLGPAAPDKRDRDDVIAQIPPTSEGMIFAEVDVENVALVETKPDKHLQDPLIRVAAIAFTWQDDFGSLVPKPLALPAGPPVGRERGVWFAPFLAAINRNIVFKLLAARDRVRARELLSGRQVRWLTAVSLRGPHDFLVTFYAPSGRENANTQVPYCTIDEDQLNAVFDPDEDFTFIVPPQQMYKFRGVIVPDAGSQEWRRQERLAQELLDTTPSRRKRLIATICRLARDWNSSEVSADERAEVAPIFSPQREATPIIDVPDGLSQAFILLSISRERDLEWALFERDIIRGWLCGVPEIRSIYKVAALGKHGGCDYWLDAVGKQTNIDGIVDEIAERAKAQRITVSSNTLTARYYLKWDSVEGIERSEQVAAVVNFMLDSSAKPVWASVRYLLDAERLWANKKIAKAISEAYFHQKNIIGWPMNGVGRERFIRFFAHLFWGNFAEGEQAREAERLAAKHEFRWIYEAAEEIAAKIVEAELRGRYRDAIERWAVVKGKPPDRIKAMMDNTVLGLIEYMSELRLGETSFRAAGEEFRSQFNPKVIHVRNRLSHVNGHNEELDFIASGDADGLESARAVSESLHTLSKSLDVLVRLRQWLNTRPEEQLS